MRDEGRSGRPGDLCTEYPENWMMSIQIWMDRTAIWRIAGFVGTLVRMDMTTPIRATPNHDDDVREQAYQLWSDPEVRRNAAEVARRLQVPVTTVRYWVKADGWRQRHAAEVFPVDRSEAYGLIGRNLAAAAIFASEQLRDHHDPDHPFRFVERVELDAAHGAVDRMGYGPVRVLTAPTFEEEKPSKSDRTQLTSSQLASLPPEQLRAMEQGRQVVIDPYPDAVEVTSNE